jgi:peptidyl-prolyl cis-trans isomerase A (cyclophilin A)
MRKLHSLLVTAGFFAAALLALPEVAASQTPPAKALAKTPAARPRTAAPGSPATRTTLDPALLRPEALTSKAPETFQVKFTTTQGDLVVTVTRDWAPLGADRFYNLVKHHFYDGASFFRVLPGFVVQFGIPARPDVARVWSHAAIKDEPVKQGNKRGYLTYAMGGPNTRTTQVFINLADNSRLDPMGFSAFGQVAEGMDVVEKLYSGYGEGAPDGHGPRQDLIESQGKAYLDKGFPKLDSIKTTTLIAGGAAEAVAPSKAPGKAPRKSPGKAPAKQPD